MQSLNFGKYFVVGHSYGGRIAGLIAAQDKEHVLGAILITPLPIKGGEHLIGKSPELFNSLLSAIQSGDADGIAKALLFLDNYVPFRSDLAEGIIANFRHSFFGEDSQMQERAPSLGKDRSSIIPSLRCPLLFFTGDRDLNFAATLAELSLFKDTPPFLHVLHDRGHMFPATHIVECASVINQFLQKHNPNK